MHVIKMTTISAAWTFFFNQSHQRGIFFLRQLSPCLSSDAQTSIISLKKQQFLSLEICFFVDVWRNAWNIKLMLCLTWCYSIADFSHQSRNRWEQCTSRTFSLGFGFCCCLHIWLKPNWQNFPQKKAIFTVEWMMTLNADFFVFGRFPYPPPHVGTSWSATTSKR